MSPHRHRQKDLKEGKLDENYGQYSNPTIWVYFSFDSKYDTEVVMQNMIEGSHIRLPRGSQKPIGASTPNSSSKDICIDEKECYSKLERCYK